jgi:hypothetical protein
MFIGGSGCIDGTGRPAEECFNLEACAIWSEGYPRRYWPFCTQCKPVGFGMLDAERHDFHIDRN